MQRQYVVSEEDQNRHLEIAKTLCISTFGKSVLNNSTKSYLNSTTGKLTTSLVPRHSIFFQFSIKKNAIETLNIFSSSNN